MFGHGRPPMPGAPPEQRPSDPELHDDHREEAADQEEDLRVSGLLADKRRLFSIGLVFLLAIVGIYFIVPKLLGLDEAIDRIDEAEWYWVVVAVLFNVAAFAAYVALFRGILGGRDSSDVRERLDAKASYQITMAGLAATRIFSAAGAGGIVLTYWALRKAGMPKRRSACRMVAFLVLTYSVYLGALVLFGVLLRTGVLPGDNPVGGTIVPAAVAAVLMLLLGLVALIPGDFERRLREYTRGFRRARFAAHRPPGDQKRHTGFDDPRPDPCAGCRLPRRDQRGHAGGSANHHLPPPRHRRKRRRTLHCLADEAQIVHRTVVQRGRLVSNLLGIGRVNNPHATDNTVLIQFMSSTLHYKARVPPTIAIGR